MFGKKLILIAACVAVALGTTVASNEAHVRIHIGRDYEEGSSAASEAYEATTQPPAGSGYETTTPPPTESGYETTTAPPADSGYESKDEGSEASEDSKEYGSKASEDYGSEASETSEDSKDSKDYGTPAPTPCETTPAPSTDSYDSVDDSGSYGSASGSSYDSYSDDSVDTPCPTTTVPASSDSYEETTAPPTDSYSEDSYEETTAPPTDSYSSDSYDTPATTTPCPPKNAPKCSGPHESPMSVEGAGTYCVAGPACSGPLTNAKGNCPGPQEGLKEGSHCAKVKTGVWGCVPGPESSSDSYDYSYEETVAPTTPCPPKHEPKCKGPNESEMSVEGVGTFCVAGPACSGPLSGPKGNCPGPQTGLDKGSYCCKVKTGVWGCLPGAAPALRHHHHHRQHQS